MHAPLEISGRRWTLAAMTAALTLVFLDQTAVSVALPSIQRDFGASHTELAWVMNAFMLTLAALAAAGGRLGDIAGRRRVLIAGLAVFAAASVGCAVAQSEGWLIAARAVQGLGAAAIMPIATAIVSDEFPDAQRGRALGIYIGVASFFLSVGPLVGGALSEFGSWRWIFLVNLPVVAATAVITVRTGAGGGVQAAGRLAPVSVATLAAGLGAVVLALMEAQTWGWDSAATAVLLAAGLVALAAFPFVQARRGEPLIRLELLRDRLYLGSALVALCSRFVVVGALVLSAIYLQEVLDLNPFQAGLALLPATIPILLAAPIAGAIVDRRGPRGPACAGMLLIAAALLSLALLAPEARYALLWPGLAAFGAGVGIVTAATSAAGMAAAFGRRRGEAAGLLTTARQLGGTIGLAAMTSAFVATEFGRLDEFLRDAAATPHERARLDLLLSGDAGRGLATAERIPADVLNAARDALAAGLEAALLVAAGVALLAAVAGLVLIRGPGRPRGS